MAFLGSRPARRAGADVERLYGRADAVGLAADLLERDDGDPRPVLIFVGPGGSGKTALLDGLESQLDQYVPYARMDCAGDGSVPEISSPATTPASIIFVPLADPDELSRPANPAHAGYQAFLADCAKYYAGFRASDRRDAWGLMTHDALLTAAQAARLAAGPQGRTVPSAKDVAGLLYNLHSANKVEGASGPIEIDADGNPAAHAIPVVRLAADGRRTPLGSFKP
ncbi:MAG: ATP-binding protein, partial [Actinoallomurus sp.]